MMITSMKRGSNDEEGIRENFDDNYDDCNLSEFVGRRSEFSLMILMITNMKSS